MTALTYRIAVASFVAIATASVAFGDELPGTSKDKLNADVEACSMGTAPEMKIAGCTSAIGSGQLDPQNAGKALNNRGNAYLALGQIDKAIADYGNSISIAPTAVGYFNRGNAYLKREQYDLAEKDYTAALQIDPTLVDALINRGVTFTNRGKYDRAIEDYDQALKVRPNFATAYVKRGTARFGKGDLAGAIQDYNEALRLEPTNGQAAEMKKRAEAAQSGKH